jgi:hypothetical protein
MTPRYQLYLSVSKVNSFGVKDAQGINFAKPVMALIDISRRNKVEGIVLDERRAGKWNTSFWGSEVGGDISTKRTSSGR